MPHCASPLQVLNPLGGGQSVRLELSFADDEMLIWRTPRLGRAKMGGPRRPLPVVLRQALLFPGGRGIIARLRLPRCAIFSEGAYLLRDLPRHFPTLRRDTLRRRHYFVMVRGEAEAWPAMEVLVP